MVTCTTCSTEFDAAAAECPSCGTPAPVDLGESPAVAAPATEAMPQPVTSGSSVVSSEDRNLGMLAHASAASAFIGLPVIGPLVMWLVYKEKSEFVGANALEALNFNISFAIWSIVAGLTVFVLIGFLLLPIVTIAWIVFAIIGAIKASEGEVYRYPLTLRLVS